MKRYAEALFCAAIAIAPLFVAGCVYVPAYGYRHPYESRAVWVPGHWYGDVWIRGHWR